MELAVYKTFETHVEEILDLASRAGAALLGANIDYRLIGGTAVYLHVGQVDPEAARMTRDVDMAIRRQDLSRIPPAVLPHGFELRHVAGVDLLVDVRNPTHKRRVHFVFAGERVHPTDLEPIPEFSTPDHALRNVLLAPVADLVRMKLTSFRLKDQVHLQDLDAVRLITPEVEARLSPELAARLAQVRASR